MRSIKAFWLRNEIKPLAAWRAMRELLRNPDDTTQVFHIIEALKGDSLGRAVRRLESTDRGRALLQAKPNIVPKLNDRAWLLSLPAGSLGRAYYDFVHAEDLSADGLIASSETSARDELTAAKVQSATLDVSILQLTASTERLKVSPGSTAAAEPYRRGS